MNSSEIQPDDADPATLAGNSAADLRMRHMFLWGTITLFILSGAAMLLHEPQSTTRSPSALAQWFAIKQDIPVVAGAVFFFSLFGSRARAIGTKDAQTRVPTLKDWQVIGLLIGFAVLLWALRTFVLFNFDLTRDEKMVTFDVGIFSKGWLYAPIPAFWRNYYEALNTLYTLPVGNREGWVSGYLPVNAALRTVLGTVLSPNVISPLEVLLGGVALWRIALRLWPDSASTRSVVMLLYIGSSQLALMGTTIYAMSTHLVFNLVWLWLFLQRRPATHAAAIAVGFFATGIHQPLFHPLFVIPFLDLLRRDREWRTLAAYVLCYGAIGLFWLSWPGWVSAHGFQPVPPELNKAGVTFAQRFANGATPLSLNSVFIMAVNLLRFFTWQNLMLLPLAIVALRSARRKDPVCRALWQGIALLIVVMTLILPLQVHGWGYRYLHGFIGSAVLLAGYGWRQLESEGMAPARAMKWATAASLLVLLPVHVWMVRAMMAPFAQASARLNAIPADVVVVDDGIAAFSIDLVLNRADLSNRPILLSGSLLSPDRIGPLCTGRSIAFVDSGALAPLDQFFGQQPTFGPLPRQAQLEDAARAAGCRMTVISR